MKKNYLDKYPFSEYKIKLPKKRVEFLSMQEINKIDETYFGVPRLNVISDIFVFCCYTGLPYIEVAGLEPKDIIQGIDGEPWLYIIHQKTKKPYKVPLLPRSLEILKKYEKNPICLKKGKLLPVPSNVNPT